MSLWGLKGLTMYFYMTAQKSRLLTTVDSAECHLSITGQKDLIKIN